jgi:hypothetical protein
VPAAAVLTYAVPFLRGGGPPPGHDPPDAEHPPAPAEPPAEPVTPPAT